MVDRLAPLREREHRGVNEFVLLAVEVFGAQALLEHDRLERLRAGEQDRAERASFGFEVVRGNVRHRVGHGRDVPPRRPAGQQTRSIVDGCGASR